MRRKLKLIGCVALCAVLLAGCQAKQEEEFDIISATQRPTQNVYAATATPGSVVNGLLDYDDGSYDPASEEDNVENTGSIFDTTYAPVVPEVTAAPTVNSAYAGASPVVIDPIDKPTPTPLPAISFSFQTYSATKLHLSFDAPVGWTVDDTSTDTYILTQPDYEAIPGYQASITVHTASVNSQYNSSDLAKEVKQMLETIGSGGFSSFSESRTAERTLLSKAGVYANYTAVTSDGVEVAGRVHVTCIDKVLYSVHVTYPLGYRDTYVDQVYGQLRKTITITK